MRPRSGSESFSEACLLTLATQLRMWAAPELPSKRARDHSSDGCCDHGKKGKGNKQLLLQHGFCRQTAMCQASGSKRGDPPYPNGPLGLYLATSSEIFLADPRLPTTADRAMLSQGQARKGEVVSGRHSIVGKPQRKGQCLKSAPTPVGVLATQCRQP